MTVGETGFRSGQKRSREVKKGQKIQKDQVERKVQF